MNFEIPFTQKSATKNIFDFQSDLSEYPFEFFESNYLDHNAKNSSPFACTLNNQYSSFHYPQHLIFSDMNIQNFNYGRIVFERKNRNLNDFINRLFSFILILPEIVLEFPTLSFTEISYC